MGVISFLFLIPLFIVGILCSYTDIKSGKIKNVHIKYGLYSVAVLYLFAITYFYFLLHSKTALPYILEMLLNGFVSLIVGYFLWHFKLWSAGDAKLFTLFALMIPLDFYANYYLKYLSAFVLLANTFSIILLFLMGEIFLSLLKSRKEFSKKIKKSWKAKNIKPEAINFIKTFLTFFVSLTAIRLIMRPLSQVSGFNPQGDFASVAIVALFLIRIFLLKRFLKNKKAIFIIGASGLIYSIYLISTHQQLLFFDTIKTTFVFMITISFFFRALAYYLEKKGTQKIKIEDLQGNMILEKPKEGRLKEIIEKEGCEAVYSGELEMEKMTLLKKILLKEENVEIKIYKTLHFAPFLFAGCIATILTKTLIFSFVLSLLR
jgi:Flp pilus assembly protein protease CpaA